MTIVYVIDTSYLLELFEVPRFSNKASATTVRSFYAKAIESKSRLFVPVSCIFETANHIADVSNGAQRHKLASKLYQSVKQSLEESVPWVITPKDSPQKALPRLLTEFLNSHVRQRIGLTDTQVIEEARRLKADYTSFGYQVHIWTTDKRVKALEPDAELSPFVG